MQGERWELLKDIPGLKAGVVSDPELDHHIVNWVVDIHPYGKDDLLLTTEYMLRYPNFFRRIPDEPPKPAFRPWNSREAMGRWVAPPISSKHHRWLITAVDDNGVYLGGDFITYRNLLDKGYKDVTESYEGKPCGIPNKE